MAHRNARASTAIMKTAIPMQNAPSLGWCHPQIDHARKHHLSAMKAPGWSSLKMAELYAEHRRPEATCRKRDAHAGHGRTKQVEIPFFGVPISRRRAAHRRFEGTPRPSRFLASRTAFFSIAVASPHQGRCTSLLETLDPPTSDSRLLLSCRELLLGQVALSSLRLLSLMPTQTGTQSQVARKVNFAIQLLHEAAELLETSPRSTRSTFTAKRPRYTRRTSAERED